MKWGTTKGVEYREGDRVEVGRGGFGRPRRAGVVAKDWDGESNVLVVLEGKTKPQPFGSSMVRHAEQEKRNGPPLKAARPSTTKAELRPVPRPRAPARSPRFLAFVRRHPCAACQRKKDVEAHHYARGRGVGQKVSDYRTVPLCDDCHRYYHDHGSLPRLDARTTRELFHERQVALLEEWILLLRERGTGGVHGG